MTSFTRRQALLGLAGISIAATVAACSSSTPAVTTASASGEVSYWLWDSNQQPVYQKVADAFHAANPSITVKITQYSWDDYWTNVTNGFVAGTAPDVFTNHLSKYPEFVTQGQLLSLDDALKADGIKTDIYQKGLADLWVGQDGKRYGLPKDFDTVSIFYNKDLVKAAGVAEADLAKMTWNPTDGGTYEKMIAHLTLDANGKRGDEAGFDKSKIKVYGLGLDGGSGGGNGQTQWSMYTGTTGWTVTDKNPWGTHYNYDKPEFQNTMTWMRSLIEKGFMPSLESITGQSSADIFGAGKYAMITNGSWMINQMFGYKGINTGLAPVPIGPSGKRSSMYNGLADSVWAGSKNQAAAVKWVEYLGSAAAQDIVGASGVVFPAIPSGTDAAGKAFGAKNIDVNSSFLVHIKDSTTFLFPITDHASQVTGVIQPAVDAVFTGKAKATTLTAANTQVNALFS
jgi:multiple sugar transport system substrate-binding protein